MPFNTVPEEKIALTIVGIVEPTDPEELYWFGDLTKFLVDDAVAFTEPINVPLYAGEQSFFSGIGARYPMLLGNFWWNVFLNSDVLTSSTVSQAEQSIRGLEADLNRAFPRSLVLSLLNRIIFNYKRDLTLARVPLFLFTSLVVGVVLYFLVVIAMMLAHDRGAETARLRSRGANVLQIGVLLGLGEGLALVLPGVLVGPFLGRAIAEALPVGDAGLWSGSVGLSPSIFLAAAIAGIACVSVFMASGLVAARQGIVRFMGGQGRQPGRPRISPYAIDLFVLVTLGVIWSQIRGRGGFLTERLLGDGLDVDFSLLLGPALALAAIGLLLFRALPLLLKLVLKFVDPVGPLWLVYALKRMARNSVMYTMLVVLLMLGTALGIFGAAVGATLTRSQADQVRYARGGELVAPPVRSFFAQPDEERQQAITRVPGVQAMARVYRATATAARGISSRPGYRLLAVDPSSLPEVAWFRNDFSGKDMATLLLPLADQVPDNSVIALPEEAEFVGIWARPERSYPDYTLYLRLRDAAGVYESVPLGALAADEWTYLEAPVPTDPSLQPPFNVVAINIGGAFYGGYGSGSIALDDVSATVAGEQGVVEGFESAGPWISIPNFGTTEDTGAYTRGAARSGRTGIQYAWVERITGNSRGLFIPPGPMPIPAIASATLGVGQELVVGILGQPVKVSIRDVAEYFPTLYPDDLPFLVVNLAHLDRYFRSLPLARPAESTELWIGMQEGIDRDVTLAHLGDILPRYPAIHDREEEAVQASRSPLEGGAWSGLALLAGIALGAVAILGFTMYVGIAVKRARLELGVLQALGMSRWHLRTMLAVEGFIMTAVGLGAGLAMGAWVGQWVLDYLGVTARGGTVVPPMELTLDGWLLGLAFTEIALAGVLSTLLAIFLAARLRLHEVLRVEE
ncbi:MAG: ABC transporter permease [Chloroflexi bacterium]|nr:ABC transporter permease [Chloroflexota bacterium]